MISNDRSSGEGLAPPTGMILLVSSSPSATELQQAVERGVGNVVQLAPTSAVGLRYLRQREFEAVILDQSASLDPRTNTLIQHVGTAVSLTVNSAVSTSSRIIAEVKNALRRRCTDRIAARRAAERELRDDLRNAVTGILLTSELALSAPAMPADAQARLRQVIELAESMKRTLDV